MRKIVTLVLAVVVFVSGCVTSPLVDLSGLGLDFSGKKDEKKETSKEEPSPKEKDKR